MADLIVQGVMTVDGLAQIDYTALANLPTIDGALSTTSTNAVQNATVKKALDEKSDITHTHSNATASSAGFMSAADKSKLDGIDDGANSYVHPTTPGYKHIPSGGAEGQILSWAEDGTAEWADSTGLAVASDSGNGLMSSTDKAKLDSLIVDSELSTTSTNLVQNNVVSIELENIGTIANAAMPKSGGTFTGNVLAQTKNHSGIGLYNMSVSENDGSTVVSTTRLKFQRK